MWFFKHLTKQLGIFMQYNFLLVWSIPIKSLCFVYSWIHMQYGVEKKTNYFSIFNHHDKIKNQIEISTAWHIFHIF